MPEIRYHANTHYKYELLDEYTIATPLRGYVVDTQFLRLRADGVLIMHSGYRWDGASGPAIDTDTFMRGSLVHDALYQLIRLGRVSLDERPAADRLLYDIVREDGMWSIRAAWVYAGVRLFGGFYLGRIKPYDQ